MVTEQNDEMILSKVLNVNCFKPNSVFKPHRLFSRYVHLSINENHTSIKELENTKRKNWIEFRYVETSPKIHLNITVPPLYTYPEHIIPKCFKKKFPENFLTESVKFLEVFCHMTYMDVITELQYRKSVKMQKYHNAARYMNCTNLPYYDPHRVDYLENDLKYKSYVTGKKNNDTFYDSIYLCNATGKSTFRWCRKFFVNAFVEMFKKTNNENMKLSRLLTVENSKPHINLEGITISLDISDMIRAWYLMRGFIEAFHTLKYYEKDLKYYHLLLDVPNYDGYIFENSNVSYGRWKIKIYSVLRKSPWLGKYKYRIIFRKRKSPLQNHSFTMNGIEVLCRKDSIYATGMTKEILDYSVISSNKGNQDIVIIHAAVKK